MEIVTYPNPSLTTISDPITEFGEETRKLVENLYYAAAHLPSGTCAGLAAPQIGVNKRIFLAMGRYFINPKITLTKQMEHGQEGCFSNPDGHSKMYRVWRSTSVWIEYQDLKRKWRKERYNGFLARVIQHEMDHLNGVMCFNREEAMYGSLIDKNLRN